MPFITFSLIGLSAVVTFLAFQNRSLYEYGFNRVFFERGKYEQFIKQIFLYQFLHGDILHLVMNSYFLYSAGPVLERAFGSFGFLLFFVMVSIVNIFALYFFATKSNTIGISGFCMALLSYLWITLYSTGSNGAGEIGTLLIINIALGFAPGISLVGHASGALAGIAFWYIAQGNF